MKILVLTSNLNIDNGWGRYSSDLTEALSKSGSQCVIITSVGGVKTTASFQLLPSLSSYKKNYFFSFWYAWRLRKYARECDIIHSFIEPYSHIAYLLSKLTSKKYFVTAHGTYALIPYGFSLYKKFFHIKSFSRAQRIICISNFTKGLLERQGLHNLSVINNGLSFEKFYDSRLFDEERENKIITVGALKYRKGYHLSLQAFAIARGYNHSLTYTIVGNQEDSTYFNYLKKIIKDLSLEDAVSFFDSISDVELVKLYRKSKLFILTPISEGAHFEGFGLVYLEAGACGLPVIGSLGSGAEDAIVNGKTGFLVKQQDFNESAQAIIKIINDGNLAKDLGKNGINWARNHDWSAIVGQYYAVYR